MTPFRKESRRSRKARPKRPGFAKSLIYKYFFFNEINGLELPVF